MKGLLSALAGAADQLDFIPGFDPRKDQQGMISKLMGGGQKPAGQSYQPQLDALLSQAAAGPAPMNAVQKRTAQGMPPARINPPNPADYLKSHSILDVLNPFYSTVNKDLDAAHRYRTHKANYEAQQAQMADQQADAEFARNAQQGEFSPAQIARMSIARNANPEEFGKSFAGNFGFNSVAEGNEYSRFGGDMQKVDKTFTPVDPAKLVIDQQNADSAALTAEAAMYRAKNPSPLVENTINGEQEPSIFQEKLDAAAADEYIAWTQGGGADAVKQLSQISEVMTRLESGEENLTGPLLGMVSPQFRALFNEGSVDAQQLVEEVVQRNLRLILGSQFTEKEGKMLIDRAYNPQLDESINAKRLGRLFTQMSTAAQQKQAQMRYLEQNGTLVGYAGTTPGMSDFFAALEEEDGGANSPDFTPQDDERLQYLEAKAAGQFSGTFEQWKSQRGTN